MKQSDKPKLLLAILVLLGAGAWMAYWFGLFGGSVEEVQRAAPPVQPVHTGGPRTINAK